jgi:hypothetical protein
MNTLTHQYIFDIHAQLYYTLYKICALSDKIYCYVVSILRVKRYIIVLKVNSGTNNQQSETRLHMVCKFLKVTEISLY